MATKKKATKKAAPKPITHLVVWDNEDADPVRSFHDVESAASFAQKLGTAAANGEAYVGSIEVGYGVKKDSIRVYEVKACYKASVSVTLVEVK